MECIVEEGVIPGWVLKMGNVDQACMILQTIMLVTLDLDP